MVIAPKSSLITRYTQISMLEIFYLYFYLLYFIVLKGAWLGMIPYFLLPQAIA